MNFGLSKETLNQIRKIVKENPKYKFKIFGSRAKNTYKKNSDIDIMILTDFNDEELAKYRMKIRDLACDLELENDIIITPIVRNIEKYNNRINVIPFYMNVQKEGVVLHG